MSKFDYDSFYEENGFVCFAFNSKKYRIRDAIRITKREVKSEYNEDIEFGNEEGKYGIYVSYLRWSFYHDEDDEKNRAGFVLDGVLSKRSCPVYCVFQRTKHDMFRDNEIALNTVQELSK